MLSSNLKSILDARLHYLPEITASAIRSVDWPNHVISIAQHYGLHMSDIEDLQMVVLKSMTGLLNPHDFEQNIINATALSPATVEQIIIELNNKIFEPIHDYVVNGGHQESNTLAQHGIEIAPDEEIIPPITETPIRDTVSAHEIIIPTSPEPVIAKPLVTGDFHEFFVTTSTKTDHSMLK